MNSEVHTSALDEQFAEVGVMTGSAINELIKVLAEVRVTIGSFLDELEVPAETYTLAISKSMHRFTHSHFEAHL